MRKARQHVFFVVYAACFLLSSLPVSADTTTNTTETTTNTTLTTESGTSDTTETTTTTEMTTTTPAPVQHTDASGRFQYELRDDGVRITAFQWETDEFTVTVPASFDGKPVTAIGQQAFQYCYASEILLPDTITCIEQRAFEGCAWLENITIPAQCKSIGMHAFRNCKRLTDIQIPTTVQEICAGAFEGTPFITAHTEAFVIFGDGVLYAYQGSESAPTIPDTVKVIAPKAFSGNEAIRTVTIPTNVERIQAGAFADCPALAEVNAITLAELAPDAFSGTPFSEKKTDFLLVGDILYAYNGKETAVEVPDSVAVINDAAFANLTAITTVKLPDSVKSVRNQAFLGCTSLQVVTLGEQVASIGDSAFRDCRTLKYLRVGHALKTVGDYAFAGCTYLEEIYLPDTLEAIGEKAFGYAIEGDTASKIKNHLVIYGNTALARDYGKATGIEVKPLPDEENTEPPPVVTTNADQASIIGKPSGSAWIPACIMGGVLIIVGLVAFITRRRNER